jgi:hypothetical protein
MVITVTCAGATIAVHRRCWATRPHVATAKRLRETYQARTEAMRGPVAATGAVVGLRGLSDCDEIFSITPSVAASVMVAGPPDLQLAR